MRPLEVPIVGAPLGGGGSTPALAAAVSGAGGLGFLASSYKTPDGMAEDIAAVRALTNQRFGVNVFAFAPTEASAEALDAYRREVAVHGAEPGEPRTDDDFYAEKVERLLADPVPVVSFTFGCPPAETIERLRAAGSEVWVTVTLPEEARAAAAAGADAVVVQGAEAGGHRGAFSDDEPGDIALLPLLQLVAAAVELPMVASGGIATGAGVAAVLAAGAVAAQIGTAFMRCPEAGTAEVHRDALARPGRTALTRAFTGRTGRGIENAFLRAHDSSAPHAYPAVHHVTSPIRAHARREGDAELLNLWAGQAHELISDLPAAELVAKLHADARDAAAAGSRRAHGG